MPDCIFCKIAQKEITVETIYENDEFLAFPDINPKAPIHILVIPKQHTEALAKLGNKETDMLGRIVDTARQIAKEQGIGESGFRLVINSGPNSGMEVGHLHLHILGGGPLSNL